MHVAIDIQLKNSLRREVEIVKIRQTLHIIDTDQYVSLQIVAHALVTTMVVRHRIF